jgi:AraC-like DNA-binding protein
MLSITMGAIEACAADKSPLKLVCPGTRIHYVLGGKGYYNGTLLTRGQGFITYKDTLCAYRPDPSDPWTYLWVRFGGTDEEGLLKKCGFPDTSGIFSFSYAEKLKAVAALIFPDGLYPDPRPLCREGYAKLLLSLHAPREAEKKSKEARWVEMAKELIATGYHKPLRVESLAAALHIDRKYLRNLFVKHTGLSTMGYLTHFRMARAAELLRMGDVSVSLVASSVGYDDPLHFSRAFKKHFGLSPTEYRRK